MVAVQSSASAAAVARAAAGLDRQAAPFALALEGGDRLADLRQRDDGQGVDRRVDEVGFGPRIRFAGVRVRRVGDELLPLAEALDLRTPRLAVGRRRAVQVDLRRLLADRRVAAEQQEALRRQADPQRRISGQVPAAPFLHPGGEAGVLRVDVDGEEVAA